MALASNVLVAGASILDSMKEIDASTLELKESVDNWSGNFLGTFPIIEKSGGLLVDIKQGKKAAENSAELTLEETFFVAQATLALSTNVNSTLETVIAAKSKFDKLLLGPVILVNLKVERHATEEFSTAVIEKIPKEFQEVAKQLVGTIDTSFAKAIEAYDLF